MAAEAGLTVGRFAAFFSALYDGKPPFDWQLDLLAEVDRRRCWPDQVNLPTGTGKTSLVDLAVYLLALDAQRPPAERWAPRRILFVVDRRVVVDQAFDHARHLANCLQDPADEVTAEVARLLRQLSAGHGPLVTTTLRGAMVRDESWARRPDVPAVIASTVDQVGSRVLFRGYGLGRGMRPIHAGLLGNDTLWLLDEVHLSRPFAQTLRRLGRYRTMAEGPLMLPDRWGVVELSATPPKEPPGEARWVYPSGPLDPGGSEVLRRRLGASKPAEVRLVADRARGKTGAPDPLVAAAAEEANRLLAMAQVRALGVIVNRVDTARAIWHRLNDTGPGTVVLLTGRMRSHERDPLVQRLAERLATGRQRQPSDPPLVVVATQCLEAGADFDLDGLLTECASLGALRQRFGRVDRDGRLSEAGTPAPGMVLARASDVKQGDDPVYGPALAGTFLWLSSLESVDFGIGALPEDLAPPETQARQEEAPLLFPAHLDAWAQTSAPPTPDPDPARWLHGPAPTVADVSVLWRADLEEPLLEGDAAQARAAVALCPPVSSETVSLPLPAVRRWLEGLTGTSVADVEGRAADEEETRNSAASASGPVATSESGAEAATRATPRRALRWRGTDSTVVGPSEIHPGDTLVVPASYGGLAMVEYDNLTAGSWDPDGLEPVADVATEAQLSVRRRAVVRLLPGLWGKLAPLVVTPGQVDEAEDLEDRAAVLACLEDLATELPPGLLKDGVQHLLKVGTGRRSRRLEVRRIGPDGDEYFVVTSALRWPGAALEGDPIGSDEDDGSFIAAAVALDRHLDDVGRWAGDLARQCGLPQPLVNDLALAARLHDLGKADPRFQVVLRQGSDAAYQADPTPLAKSAGFALTPARRRRARELSGYPEGARHELMSLALIEGAGALVAEAGDWDLVRHLVASHHGWCRPFAPVSLDQHPVVVSHQLDGSALVTGSDHDLARLDAGVPERFWTLVRRYGWYGLAWLEAVLRLADHRASEEEQDSELGTDDEQPAARP